MPPHSGGKFSYCLNILKIWRPTNVTGKMTNEHKIFASEVVISMFEKNVTTQLD